MLPHSSPTRSSGATIDIAVVAIFIATVAASFWLFSSGGMEALLGLAIGAIIGFSRQATGKASSRQVFDSAFAGLWGGLIIGGMLGGAIVHLVSRLF